MSVLRKVLIVDDSKLIHQMYRLVLLRFRDCKIVDAMNGLEALDILAKENDFDLVLLDVNMPIMNGIQFMEKVRETGVVNGKTSIIVVSTEGREEDTAKAMRLGAHGYIMKPFKSEGLLDLIEKVVAKRSPAMAAGGVSGVL